MTEDKFFLDPLEDERRYPEEPIYNDYIRMMPLGTKYLFAGGRTEFLPDHPLIVGCCYDIIFKYLPEEQDLPQGTRVAFSIPRTWSQPQTENESGPGFVSVCRLSGGPVSLSLTQNENLQWWIVVELTDSAEIREGGVCVNYSHVTIQRFPQSWFGNWRSAMRTIVDLTGKGGVAVVPAERTQKPVIIAAPPACFNVASTPVVKPGEPIRVRFSTLDYCHNQAHPAPVGEVFATLPDTPFTPAASLMLKEADKGCSCFNIAVPDNARTVRVVVSNRKDNLRGISPTTIIDDRPDMLNVYFGDIHGHTMLSDGLKTPMEYFRHARDIALMDFGAIADHNCKEASRIEGPFRNQMSDEAFAEIQHACESFNKAGDFVTLQAFEQNILEKYPGHRNIYFRDTCPGLFRGQTLEELYAYLDGYDALIIPHHTLIWNTRVHLSNLKYERLVEMFSVHCSNEYKDTPVNNYRTTLNKEETGISAREILESGYRVGFIASSDNHNGAPGLSARPSRFTNLTYSGGLAAVLAPELTRETVFDALYHRRCYATTGARIYLDFRLDGKIMGSEIKCEPGHSFPYEIRVSGTDRIASVEIIRNGQVEILWKYDGQDNIQLQGVWQFEEKETWVYVKVIQVDRHMAWSSPIWIEQGAIT